MSRRIAFAVATLFLLPAAYGFSFAYSPPSQCGELTITWTGGTAPFSLLITPSFDVPRNISVPSTAFANGKGNFTTQLTVASQKTFLLTMSDGTGFGTGGTSDLLTVADPLNGATCDTTTPSIPFTFELNSSLQQCREYNISGYGTGAPPVTIYGLIPLGSTFALQTPVGSTSYNWLTNIAAGTRLILTLTDGLGRSGGSSDTLTVGASDDATCINSASPASTITGSPSSTSSSSSSTSTSGASTGGGKSGVGGIVAGAVIGTIVIFVVVGTLVWFCLKKRRNKKDTPHTSTLVGKRAKRTNGVDLAPHDPELAGHLEAGHHYEPEPYVLPSSTYAASSQGQSDAGQYPPNHPGFGWSEDRGGPNNATASSRASKFSEAFSGRTNAPNSPARFVLHTDAGEVPEDQGENSVVELPPQYTSIGGRVVRAPTYRERGTPGVTAAAGSGSGSSPSGEGGRSTGPSSS